MTLPRLSQDFGPLVPLLAGRRVALVDVPFYRNIGDILIFLGTMEFFRRHEVHLVGAVSNLDASDRHIQAAALADVIVGQGGGNFGDIYPRNQSLRERALAAGPDKPCVILPQSIHFASEAEQARSGAAFRAHPRTTICVRDRESEQIARAGFTDDVRLCQDMAHNLHDFLSAIGRERPRHEGSGEKTLYFLRSDSETASEAHQGDGPRFDWPSFLTLGEKLRVEAYRRTVRATRVLPALPVPIVRSYETACRALVTGIARRFIQYDHVVTSRLHGVLFALMLGRKVTLLDNSYGKNTRYARDWLTGVDTLTIAPGAA